MNCHMETVPFGPWLRSLAMPPLDFEPEWGALLPTCHTYGPLRWIAAYFCKKSIQTVRVPDLARARSRSKSQSARATLKDTCSHNVTAEGGPAAYRGWVLHCSLSGPLSCLSTTPSFAVTGKSGSQCDLVSMYCSVKMRVDDTHVSRKCRLSICSPWVPGYLGT